MGKEATRRVVQTRDYAAFVPGTDNRPVDLSRRKRLRESMEAYGFLHAYPISVRQTENGRFVIKDGQHRFALARELNLPLWYIIDESKISVAAVNCTQKAWTFDDYIGHFAGKGNKHYQDLIAFATKWGLTRRLAATVLAGLSGVGRGLDKGGLDFKSGGFVVRDRDYADSVAMAYSVIASTGRPISRDAVFQALCAIFRCRSFSSSRLLSNVRRKPELIQHFGTREACLAMFEDIYNHGFPVKSHYPLKLEAEKAVAARNPANRGKL